MSKSDCVKPECCLLIPVPAAATCLSPSKSLWGWCGLSWIKYEVGVALVRLRLGFGMVLCGFGVVLVWVRFWYVAVWFAYACGLVAV